MRTKILLSSLLVASVFSVFTLSPLKAGAADGSAIDAWEKRIASGDLAHDGAGFAPLLKAAFEQGVFAGDSGQDRFRRTMAAAPQLWHWRDETGQTIAHWLADKDEVRLMAALLTSGGDKLSGLFLQDDAGRLPMHFVRSESMARLISESLPLHRYFLEAVRGQHLWSDPDKAGQTPLQRMVEAGRASAVRFIARELCRQSPTWIGRHTVGLGGWALDQWFGNELNVPDSKGRTALHLAAIADSLPAAEALASCPSTELGLLDEWGRTALHYAAGHPNFSSGYAILTRGTRGLDSEGVSEINIDAQDVNGDTALHLAYRCGNREGIDMLRRFGAHNLRNTAGQMPDQIQADPAACNKAGAAAAAAVAALNPGSPTVLSPAAPLTAGRGVTTMAGADETPLAARPNPLATAVEPTDL